MSALNRWECFNITDEYVDFSKEVLTCDDEGYTSLDVRLTFSLEGKEAYMVVAWHNNDGNTVDLPGDRKIDWDAAIRLLGDTPVPEELK